jgi:hypothetical protein
MPFLLIVAVIVGVAVLMFFIGLARAVEPSESDRIEDYLGDRATSGLGRCRAARAAPGIISRGNGAGHR